MAGPMAPESVHIRPLTVIDETPKPESAYLIGIDFNAQIVSVPGESVTDFEKRAERAMLDTKIGKIGE